MMKTHFSGILCAGCLSLFIAGCGPGDSPPSTTPEAGASQTLSLDAEPGAEVMEGAELAATQPPPAIDFAGERPINDAGQPMSDLELLNEALEAYRMSDSTSIAVKGNFQTPEEEQAALEAQQQPKPITDLAQLVRAGLIKSLPAPPAGKEFRIDNRSGQVVLADKP